MQYSIPQSQPVPLSPTSEMQVYGLFALAMGITAFGVYAGGMYAPMMMANGMHIVLLIASLGIIFTARMWMTKSPLNIILFGLFPLISGFMIAPYIWYVSKTYVNGNIILMNALTATTFMAGAAALFARTTSWNLNALGRTLFFALLGLLGMIVLQIFVPSLRQSIGFEMGISAAGIVIFALFTAYDMQRIMQMSKHGANPFMLALSLYLDIFNLFLYVLRFMMILSGERR